MRLSDGTNGSRYVVENIDLNLSVKRRLQILGMTHGAVIHILNQKKSGPMIIKVRGTRFALGRGFCKGISVKEFTNGGVSK